MVDSHHLCIWFQPFCPLLVSQYRHLMGEDCFCGHGFVPTHPASYCSPPLRTILGFGPFCYYLGTFGPSLSLVGLTVWLLSNHLWHCCILYISRYLSQVAAILKRVGPFLLAGCVHPPPFPRPGFSPLASLSWESWLPLFSAPSVEFCPPPASDVILLICRQEGSFIFFWWIGH